MRQASSEYETGASFSRGLTRAERALLPAAIEAAERMLEPAGPAVINKAVIVLSALSSQAMGDGDAKIALQLYRIGLKDVPRDLLSKAVEIAARDCDWRPMPAKLRKFIEPELKERELTLKRLRAAASVAPAPPSRIQQDYAAIDTKAILDQHWPDRDELKPATVVRDQAAIPVGPASPAGLAFAKRMGIIPGDDNGQE